MLTFTDATASAKVDLPIADRAVTGPMLACDPRGVLAPELSGDCFFEGLDEVRRMDCLARPRMLFRRTAGLIEGFRLHRSRVRQTTTQMAMVPTLCAEICC